MIFPDAILWLLDGVCLLFGHVGARSSFPRPLTAEEEAVQVARAAEGDPEAKRLLVEHNLRLVAHIIKKM